MRVSDIRLTENKNFEDKTCLELLEVLLWCSLFVQLWPKILRKNELFRAVYSIKNSATTASSLADKTEVYNFCNFV